MGEARQKQYSRQEFLREHPLCCYCGDTATTTDHCPPRSCFIQRTWPEGYEFPCCESCNARGRRDEQIVAILTRISFTKDFGPTARMEWEKLFRGLRNNQPQVADEWMSIGPSQMKRDFRSKYGNLGDRMRIDGYGAIRLGPLTRSAMHGFSTKLGQALYYMHCKEILEGEVISRHIDASTLKENDEAWLNLLQMAPWFAAMQRGNKSLTEQFSYRFNASIDLGVTYALVRFSDQVNFQIIAVRRSIADQLTRLNSSGNEHAPSPAVQIVLKPRPARGDA